MKGVLYVMTTGVPGLIVLSECSSDNFEERIKWGIERDTLVYGVSGCKLCFAIEMEDYREKREMLEKLFSAIRLKETCLFAADKDLIIQLLSSFDGKAIYPPDSDGKEIFNKIASKDNESVYSKIINQGSTV